jgi:hypothetical protein
LIAKDLPAMRLRRARREKRAQVGLHDDLYRFQKEMGGDFMITVENLEGLGGTCTAREEQIRLGF